MHIGYKKKKTITTLWACKRTWETDTTSGILAIHSHCKTHANLCCCGLVTKYEDSDGEEIYNTSSKINLYWNNQRYEDKSDCVQGSYNSFQEVIHYNIITDNPNFNLLKRNFLIHFNTLFFHIVEINIR